MKYKIVLVDINKLKCHEEVNKKHLKELIKQIVKDKKLKRPIIVDNKNFIVLDGTHRFNAFKALGINKIPCQMVDYDSLEVRVYLRRKNLLNNIIKTAVRQKIKAGGFFPAKTTRHLIKNRIGMINYPLKFC